MRYRLLVFDWDGTIIDSASSIAECIRLAAGDIGLEVPTREQASHVIGLGLQDALRLAVPGLKAEQTSEFVARYRYHFLSREDSMDLFGGMRELIEGMSQERTLSIATGKSRRGLDRALEATRLKPFFRASRCADETNPKPHPAMLREILKELEVPPEAALMIGDTSHDLQMARAAGVDAVAVTYGAHPESGLRACGPKGCVASVAQLREWLTVQG
ncbi:MAG TPA: HAD-IA family hydrolase [Burkholderiales bacterium]|nr:HAD-IA family hydrolase [Burkholderiales bacterium]